MAKVAEFFILIFMSLIAVGQLEFVLQVHQNVRMGSGNRTLAGGHHEQQMTTIAEPSTTTAGPTTTSTSTAEATTTTTTTTATTITTTIPEIAGPSCESIDTTNTKFYEDVKGSYIFMHAYTTRAEAEDACRCLDAQLINSPPVDIAAFSDALEEHTTWYVWGDFVKQPDGIWTWADNTPLAETISGIYCVDFKIDSSSSFNYDSISCTYGDNSICVY